MDWQLALLLVCTVAIPLGLILGGAFILMIAIILDRI